MQRRVSPGDVARGPAAARKTDLKIRLHKGDLPDGLDLGASVAVDTETLGLNPNRDRLCLVQLSAGDGTAHIVQFGKGAYAAPNLVRLMQNTATLKLFHFARFDLATIRRYLGVMPRPCYCTRTASRLVRTYTDRHGLKDLVKELLGHDLWKQKETSDGGADEMSEAQREYAASNVRYLHALKEKLDERLDREGRTALAQACFDFLPTRALLDIAGWPEQDIFAHDG